MFWFSLTLFSFTTEWVTLWPFQQHSWVLPPLPLLSIHRSVEYSLEKREALSYPQLLPPSENSQWVNLNSVTKKKQLGFVVSLSLLSGSCQKESVLTSSPSPPHSMWRHSELSWKGCMCLIPEIRCAQCLYHVHIPLHLLIGLPITPPLFKDSEFLQGLLSWSCFPLGLPEQTLCSAPLL